MTADERPSGALSSYGGVVLDVDGVLVHGTVAITGAAEALDRIRSSGRGIAVATNNATRTPAEVARVLGEAGVRVDPSEVVTSSQAAATLLDPGTRCLVIGMDGLHAALAERGCVEVREPDDADAVVVGLDTGLVWDDLRRATLALRAGAAFVATNGDRTLPTPDGLVPGNGATVAALIAASDREPVYAGKPAAPMLRSVAEQLGGGSPLMVGDRLDTDIAGAAALGWDTALVLTGVSTRAEVEAAEHRPTYVAASLAELVERAGW